MACHIDIVPARDGTKESTPGSLSLDPVPENDVSAKSFPRGLRDQNRRKWLRRIFLFFIIVFAVLGVTFALFAALGLLHNENGFLSSKSVLRNKSPSSLDNISGENVKAWDWKECVVLLSIDGFHPSYLSNPNARNLRKFGNLSYDLFYFSL